MSTHEQPGPREQTEPVLQNGREVRRTVRQATWDTLQNHTVEKWRGHGFRVGIGVLDFQARTGPVVMLLRESVHLDDDVGDLELMRPEVAIDLGTQLVEWGRWIQDKQAEQRRAKAGKQT